MEHFAFPGNIDFAADDQRIFHVLFVKGSCVYSSGLFIYETMFTIGESRARHRTTSITSGWKSSIFNRNSSGERRLKFIASREDDDNKKPRAKHREKRLAQRRQRRQHSDHKQVQKQRQNTTITRQMEPMKRGNTDCRRFKRRWGDQATLTVYSKIIFFDAAIGSNSYTICTSRTGADLGGGCRGYAPPLSP